MQEAACRMAYTARGHTTPSALSSLNFITGRWLGSAIQRHLQAPAEFETAEFVVYISLAPEWWRVRDHAKAGQRGSQQSEKTEEKGQEKKATGTKEGSNPPEG